MNLPSIIPVRRVNPYEVCRLIIKVLGDGTLPGRSTVTQSYFSDSRSKMRNGSNGR